jgi:hypothetical protein
MARRSKGNEEELQTVDVLTDTVECSAGWRAWTIHWPAKPAPRTLH